MINSTKKLILLLFLLLNISFFAFSQNEEVIILPDISTELTSDSFSFDKAAIPDFKVEPLKFQPIQREEIKPEPETKTDYEELIEDVPEVVVVSPPVEESVEKQKALVLGVGGDFGISNSEFNIAPKFTVKYKKDNFIVDGKLILSVGGTKIGLIEPLENQDKYHFFGLESITGTLGFELPKDILLTAKLGIELYQCNGFDFAIPMALKVDYKGFSPYEVFVEIGQKTFNPFDSMFYGALGGKAKFSYFEDTLSIAFGKKIGINNNLSFSTNREKYEIDFSIEYIFNQSPYFSIGGLYKF